MQDTMWELLPHIYNNLILCVTAGHVLLCCYSSHLPLAGPVNQRSNTLVQSNCFLPNFSFTLLWRLHNHSLNVSLFVTSIGFSAISCLKSF